MQHHVCVFSRQALCFAVFLLFSWADHIIAFPTSPLPPAYRKAHWGWLLCWVAKVYAQAKTAGHNAAGSKSTLDPRECDGGVYMCICLGLRLALIPRISLSPDHESEYNRTLHYHEMVHTSHTTKCFYSWIITISVWIVHFHIYFQKWVTVKGYIFYFKYKY